VRLDDVLDDGQSEARAALLARTRLVGAVEALEDARNVLAGDARAVVLDLDENLVEHVAEADARQTALLAVVNRVDNQVDEDLTDEVLVGQHPEGRGEVVGPLDLDADVLAVGLHFGLLGNLLGQRHHVELLHLHARHVALELRNRIEVVDDVNQPVDALFSPLEVLAVNQLVLQPAVEQRRDVALDVENRGLQLVGHIAQILLAEALGLLQTGNLLVVGVGPGGELLADVLHVLVAQFREHLARMDVARKDNRVNRLELVGDVFADDEECQQRHHHEDNQRGAERHPPHPVQQKHARGDAEGRNQTDNQRSALLGFDADFHDFM